MKKEAQRVIEAIKSGKNQEALQYLYKAPLNKIRSFVLKNSGTIDDANDVFQDAVISLFDYVLKGKYKNEYELDGFLFRIAKNKWIDMARKDKKLIREEMQGFDHSDQSNFLNDLIEEEKLEVFHKLFNQLENNCKKILSYVMFEKKSMKEVANIMQLKDEKVAKNQHYRCKKYFSQLLFENQAAVNLLRN